MCQECLITLSKQFMDLSKETPEMSNIMADMSLLCFAASQFKHPMTLNTILSIARVASEGPTELASILMSLTVSGADILEIIEKEKESVPTDCSL